ncbi:MAG: putative sulfate exporter family transporter [Deltaproteobacteria bacterium]|nr:putative sulfate exporter family transporter [Deltaproteobacteria bacterium]
MRSETDLVPGVVCCLLIGAFSYVSNRLILSKVSPLLWAFIYSILIANLVALPSALNRGINFCSTSLLRFAVVVFGLTVSIGTWTTVGFIGLLHVVLVAAFGLSFGLWVGRLMGLEKTMAILIAVGTSICGASAIAATGPVVKARDEEMGVAIACITLFGLIAMVAYPFIFWFTGLGDWLKHSQVAFGVWAGTGIHETAQVMAAGAQVGKEAADVALVTKSVRIFLIAPVILLASIIFAQGQKGSGTTKSRFGVPVFAVAFVVATLVNSALLFVPLIHQQWSSLTASFVKPVSAFLLATAFAGVGFKVKYGAISMIGMRAFVVGLAVALATGIIAFLLLFFVYVPFGLK